MTNDELIQKAQAVVNPRQIAHGFTVGDVGLRWLYYLGFFASLAIAVNGPGSLALEGLLPLPRWLRS